MNDNNEFKGIDFSEYNTHLNESDIDFSKIEPSNTIHTNQNNYGQPNPDKIQIVNDTPIKIVVAIFSFIFPIVGIILYFVFKSENKPELSKLAIKTVGIKFLIDFIVVALIIGAMFLFFKKSIDNIETNPSLKLYQIEAMCREYGEEYELRYSTDSEVCIGENCVTLDINQGALHYCCCKEREEILTTPPVNNSKYKIEDVKSKEVKEWYKSINNKTYVITVLAGSYCGHCHTYKPIITEYANNRNLTLHFIEIDKLDTVDYEFVTTYFDLTNFENYVPYTFIIKDGRFVQDHTGILEDEELDKFIRESRK